MSRFFSLLAALWLAATASATAGEAQAVTVKSTGTGAPILLIPGLSNPGDVWNDIAPAISNGREIHIAHYAGFAGAPPIEGPFFDTRIAGLKAYLEKEDLNNVVVIGHSLGGFSAMKLALEAPDRISKIVIVDSVPFLAQFFLGAQNLEQAKPRAEAMRTQLVQMTDGEFEAQQRRFAPTQARDEARQGQIIAWALASDRQTFADATYELLTTDLRQALAEIETPMLVVYPWRSALPFTAEQTDAAYAAQYAKAPSAKMLRIDDSAHFIMFDQPEALAGAINDFLAD